MLSPESLSGFQLDTICSSRFRLDGGAMFGVVPKTLWQRSIEPDDLNRIPLACNCLLLRREERIILIDSGMGDKWNEKLRDIYCTEEFPTPTIVESLAKLGIQPEAVTDVIVTHLHFDHSGGLTRAKPDGSLEPTFLQARHWIQSQHLDWALKPSEKDRGSFPLENIEPIVQADLFCLTRGTEELFTGLSVHLLNGHTKAMQAVLIDGDRPLFYPADLVPTTAHLHLPYIMAYDNHPLQTLEEKKFFLDQAVEHDWLLSFEHDADINLASIERFQGRYRVGNLKQRWG